MVLLLVSALLLLGSLAQCVAWIYVLRKAPALIQAIHHALKPPYGPNGPIR